MRMTCGNTCLMAMLTLAGLGAGPNTAPVVADAAEKNDAAAVMALVKRGSDVNQPQADGGTALHWAAHWNDGALAKRLLAAGARVNLANDYGVTPVFLAAANGSAEMLNTLLEAGGSANAALPSGETVLMSAVRSGNIAAVKRLLSAGANPNAPQVSKGQTALMWAVSDTKIDLARVLLDAGADLHATSTAGFTPLMFAAREGSIDVARLLLTAGDSLEASARDGSTPLLIATVKGHSALALFFLEQGAKPDGNLKQAGYSPLMWAVGTFEQIPIKYKGLDIDGEWSTFAGLPDRDDKIRLIKSLLAYGADINAKGTKGLPQMTPHNGSGARPPHVGATAFVIAAQSADAEIMHLLLANGADPLLRASDGQTAAMAAAEGILENVLLLTEDKRLPALKTALDAGVDIEALDKQGYRVMHVAARAGFHDIIKYLIAKGAEKDPLSFARKGQSLDRYLLEAQSPLGLVEGTVDGIFYERPDTAAFLRTLGFTSVGRFTTNDYEKISPEATDKAVVPPAARPSRP